MRASDPRDFIVDIPRSDRKRRGFGSQIADGAKERLIFLHVEGLALTRKMPVIDLLLHLIADRQQLAIAWCQVIEDRASSLPEGVGIHPRAGQRAFLDKARQGRRHLQSKPLSLINRSHPKI